MDGNPLLSGRENTAKLFSTDQYWAGSKTFCPVNIKSEFFVV